MGSIYLRGIVQDGDGTAQTGQLAEIAQGGVLFLRGGPAIYITVNSGRWSNPDTWDEGEQPGPDDMAVVRHTVHAGYVRQNDNFATDENVRLDQINTGQTTEDAFVGKVLVDDTYAFDNPADYTGIATLMLGGDKTYQMNPNDTDMVDVGWGQYEFTNPGGFELEASSAPFTNLEQSEANSGTTANDVTNGLVIFAGATLIVDGNASSNDNQVNNLGKVVINEDDQN